MTETTATQDPQPAPAVLAPLQRAIRLSSLPNLQARLDRLNRRAAKLGVAPVTLTAGEPYVKTAKAGPNHPRGYTIQMVEVTVAGETPRLAGWTLLAVRDFSLEEPLLNRVPGTLAVDLLAYTNGPALCDHCETARKRNDTFILLHDDGTLRQVGRNCLSDFLGGVSPAHLVWLADTFRELGEALDDEDSWGGEGGRAVATVEILPFLEVTSGAIRQFGWLGTTKARESGGTATATTAFDDFFPPPQGSPARAKWVPVQVEKTDKERAAATLAWAREIDPNDDNDYKRNLGRALRSEIVREKHAGLVASAVSAWAREMEFELERRKRAASLAGSAYVGEVGKRLKWVAATKRKPATEGLTLTVLSLKTWESDWGVTHFYKFVDGAGNLVVWFASKPCREPEYPYQGPNVPTENYTWYETVGGSEIETGKTYKFNATVKKHEEREGVKQTVLSRGEVVEVVNA